MNVIEALHQRKSTRAFLPRAVDKAVIEEILDAARHAPSGANTQPWQVAVVMGEKKRELEQRFEAAFSDVLKFPPLHSSLSKAIDAAYHWCSR